MIGFRGLSGLRALCALAAAWSSSGCSLFTSVEPNFVTNRPLLERAAEEVGYRVDAARFTLTAADVREDSVTFRYRGVTHIGDTAWVVRFSQKTTEQDPVSLSEAYALLPVVADGRRNFAVVDDGETVLDEHEVRFVRYRFDSSIRDENGEPLPARGILAVLSQQSPGGDTVVYRIKVDNHGDRAVLDAEALRPFVDALP
jgi:hypothetical protein